MEPEALNVLTSALHRGDATAAKQLKENGVLRLSTDQAISIVEQRL